MGQGQIVDYNTDKLIVKDIKTFVGYINSGNYYRGQVLKFNGTSWVDASTSISVFDETDGVIKLGIFLGAGLTPAGSPKTSAIAFNDAIIVFGDVYEGGIVKADGTPLTLSEADKVELMKSGIFVRRI